MVLVTLQTLSKYLINGWINELRPDKVGLKNSQTEVPPGPLFQGRFPPVRWDNLETPPEHRTRLTALST